MTGVSILLFGPPTASLTPEQCPGYSQAGAAGPDGLGQLSHTKSDNKGEFIFPVVPPGEYKQVTFYKGYTQFEVTSSMLDLSVKSGSVHLPSPFLITGFSVQGIVLSSTSGSPMTLSSSAMTFSGMAFTKHTVNVSPSSPPLPFVIPTLPVITNLEMKVSF